MRPVQHARPLLRDGLASTGSPVVAARYAWRDAASHGPTPITHSYAALAFHTGGRSRVEMNGEWNVGEGDVLVVPAGAPHRMLEMRGLEAWWLSFRVPSFAAQGPLLEPFERVRDGAAAVVKIPAPRQEYLASLFRELESAGDDAREAVPTSLLRLILAGVERGSLGAPRGTGRGVAFEALRFIERNCLRPLTLEAVAAAVRRSPTYVTTALTKATGRSAVQWIVSGRMAEARRLLLHSDARIEIVAERVGYADATHFIRMFRREHGVTPAVADQISPRPASSAVSSILIIVAAIVPAAAAKSAPCPRVVRSPAA